MTQKQSETPVRSAHLDLADVGVMQVTTDRLCPSPAAPGDLVDLRHAAVHVMTPFGRVENAEGGVDTLFQYMRMWPQAFTPGSPAVLDAMAGPRGSAATYDPDWVSDGKNGFLEPKADAVQVINRLKSTLAGVDPVALTTVEPPTFWGRTNESWVSRMKFSPKAVMRAIYDAARKGQPVQLPDDGMGWAETLHGHDGSCTAEGWERFWQTLSGYEEDADGNVTNMTSEADHVINAGVLGLMRKNGNSVLVPMNLLRSTVGIQDVFLEATDPTPFRMDLRSQAYNQLAKDLAEDQHGKTRVNSGLIQIIPGVIRYQAWAARGRLTINPVIRRSKAAMSGLRSRFGTQVSIPVIKAEMIGR